MLTLLDYVQIILWAIAYLLVIAAGWKSRGRQLVSMPYTAGVLNFAWELCALQQQQGFWGHILWVGLDVIIFSIGYTSLRGTKGRFFYIVLTYVATLGVWYAFQYPNGMLISVFAIDLIMAIAFLADRKRLSPELKVPIAVFKLLGDLCAGIFYMRSSTAVAVMAVIVLLCNIYYLFECCREKNNEA